MADILVLQSSPVAVQRIRRALEMDTANGTRHVLRPCRDWSELLAHAARASLGLALVDPYLGGRLASGEIRRLRERAPRVEVVAYADFSASGAADAFSLALLGVRAVVARGVDDTPAALRECLALHLNATGLDTLMEELGGTVPPRILSWLAPVLRSPAPPCAAGLARLARCSPRTLRRTLLRAGLPPAGELLAWCRLLHAVRLIEDAHWSVDGAARTLGYSSGSALRRSLRRLTGLRPGQVIAGGGLRLATALFVDRCRRAPASAQAAGGPGLAPPDTGAARAAAHIGGGVALVADRGEWAAS